jgi:hypothetical protein
VTDRVVAKRFDVRPMSPCLDRLTNNATKARAAVAEFLRENPKMAVPPFRPDVPGSTRFVAIEAYPAVWWSEKWINLTSACLPEAAKLEDRNARDALTCALNAGWYDWAVSGMAGRRFPLLPPLDPAATPSPEILPRNLEPERLAEYDSEAAEEDREAIGREGWIYAPDAARGGTQAFSAPGEAAGGTPS